MTVELRPMMPEDLETVVRLEHALFAADPPWTMAQFEEELSGVPENRWYAVAIVSSGDDQGAIVGYAGLRAPSIPGEPADVQTIAVAPAHQRRGVGTVLMDAMFEEAHLREAGSIMLEVRADNDVALAFYARYGFERIATRRFYYAGECNGLVMRRRLRKR